MRLAIDAANFARDRRGMGRLGRAVLRLAFDDPTFEVTLLAAGRADRAALREEFGNAEPVRSARERERYDVVWFPFNGMRFVPRAPAVVAIMDAFAFTEPHPDPIARWREQRPIRRAARHAAKIVTISHWSHGEIARALRLDPASIEVVQPTAEPFWHPGAGDRLPDGIAGARFALLVGVREPRKNARLAIEACARALCGEELLVVVGSLAERDRTRARELGLHAGEIAPGDATLRALYRNATVVLVPSTAEGFGLVALEALACGAPVLAANAAALPEATAGAAELLDPQDISAWARAIRARFDAGTAPRVPQPVAGPSFAHAMLDVMRAVANPGA